MNSVRLWYKKSGLTIYTSHLDMNRCFTRALRMAGIPLWYTEGFNPHPYLTFLLPLPLGQTGLREPVDIRTVEEITDTEIMNRLNSVLPGGVEIVEVTQPLYKVNSVESAKYEISIQFENDVMASAFCEGVKSTVASGELMAEKRTKKGFKTINLCEMIFDFSADCAGKAVNISAVLATGTEKNLNAGLLTDTLLAEFGAQSEKTDITRTEIYIENLKKFE